MRFDRGVREMKNDSSCFLFRKETFVCGMSRAGRYTQKKRGRGAA
ncbi:hypothetical protein OH687_03980 [Burkholderia anthina]|nr:hypothetical protein OH687_03980 [Burkholderia anthina]